MNLTIIRGSYTCYILETTLSRSNFVIFLNQKYSQSNEKTTFIDILAYCLMPNHFHIVIKEDRENAATEFMRKICTSYSMYYNLKYKHSGTIFQGGLKKKFVEDERYLATLINYIHLNPYGIENPNATKEMKYENMADAMQSSAKYEYSSYKDYLGESRPQGAILRCHLDMSR